MQIDDIFQRTEEDGVPMVSLKVSLPTAYLCLARGDLQDFPDMELQLAQLIIMVIVDNRQEFSIEVLHNAINYGAVNMVEVSKKAYASDPRVRTAMMLSAATLNDQE